MGCLHTPPWQCEESKAAWPFWKVGSKCVLGGQQKWSLHAVWVGEAEKKELFWESRKEDGKEFKSTWKLGKRILLWKHFNLDVLKVETLVSTFRKPQAARFFQCLYLSPLAFFTYLYSDPLFDTSPSQTLCPSSSQCLLGLDRLTQWLFGPHIVFSLYCQ